MKKYFYIILPILTIAVIFFFAFGSIQAAVYHIIYRIRFTQGLVGYWSFDGNDINWSTGQVADLSGNSNTGNLIGIATSTTFVSGPVLGVVGQALLFSGASQYINVPSSASLAALTGDMSIAAWVNVKNFTNYNGIASKTASNLPAPFDFYLSQTTGVPSFLRGNGTFNCGVAAANAPALNTWQFIVVTMSGTSVTFYLNGAQNGSPQTCSTTIADAGKALKIGSRDDLVTMMRGAMDEVRIYNRALSSGEVAYQYQVTSPLLRSMINASQDNKFTRGLVGFWSFNGPDINWATNQATDVSGNGNNGQMLNFSTSTSPDLGIIGQALRFNGINNSINVGPSSVVRPTNVTVITWVKSPTANWNQYGCFVAQRSGNNQGYILHPDANAKSVEFCTSVGGAFTCTSFTPSPAITQWHQYAGTFDGSNNAIYFDGGLQAFTPQSGSLAYGGTTEPLYIGRDSPTGGFNRFCNTTMDEVRIYNRALSSGEIYDLYRTSAPSLRSQINANQNSKNTGGLVGFWSFNGPDMNWSTGQALDVSGNGHNAQLQKTSTSTTPTIGIIGQGLLLNGGANTGSYLDLGNPTDFQFSDDLTFSMWIKPTANVTQNSFASLIDKHNTAGYVIEQNSTNQNQFYFSWDNGSFVCTGTTFTLTAGVWQHLAVVKSGGIVTHYINGSQVAQCNGGSGSIIYDSTNVHIGNEAGFSGREYAGAFDEVRFYNRALSSQEVYSLYQSGRR